MMVGPRFQLKKKKNLESHHFLSETGKIYTLYLKISAQSQYKYTYSDSGYSGIIIKMLVLIKILDDLTA